MKVLVCGSKYFDEGPLNHVYEGESLEEIIPRIAETSSYDQFDELWYEEHDIVPGSLSSEEMLKILAESNGDGCDYITGIYVIKGDIEQLTF